MRASRFARATIVPIVTIAALLLAAPALAETPKAVAPGADGGDGAFVRFGLGFGRVRARTTTASKSEPSVLDSFALYGAAMELTLGGRVGRFAIGGTVLEHAVEVDRNWRSAAPLAGEFTFTLFSLGPSVDWHRDARSGPFFGAMVGLSQFSGGTDEAPLGVATSVHGGWDFAATARSTFGISARVTYARLDAEARGRQDLFSPMVVLAWVRR